MVADHHTVKPHLAQRTHDLPHLHVAIVHESLSEMRNRGADVAEVDLPKLAHAAEIADGADHVHAHQFPALKPGPAAQAHADIGTLGDLERALVAFKVAEDAARH